MQQSAQPLRSTPSPQTQTALPVILLASVVQGWALYGLHDAITAHHWPATDNAWLIALYAVAVFVPLTMQLFAGHARRSPAWMMVATIAVAYFYFGWHHGRNVLRDIADEHSGPDSPSYFEVGLIMSVLWLLIMPFLENRLETGRWRVTYESLFRAAWRNKLMLAEAALFTVLFWLLLFLWQKLFDMLGISYFTDLFQEPIFIYPVTALTFGIALHLIGTIDRLTSVALEQILNVLKWLALVASTILVFFSIALLLRTPDLVFTGKRAISATWLLWLTAVVVLLINAAYRDGSVESPYPRLVARLMRIVIPMTILITLTAFYALVVRARHYGITVEREWAFIVASAALLYSVGYSIAGTIPGPWLAVISRVNVAVAIGLIVVVAGTLTPLLSPHRIAANSQYRRILDQPPESSGNRNAAETPFTYLRFDSGQYGRDALKRLSELQNHPRAKEIRIAATAAIAQKNRWLPPPPADLDAVIKQLPIYPAGRNLDAALVQALKKPSGPEGGIFTSNWATSDQRAGLFVDLNGDGSDEFVLLDVNGGSVYSHQDVDWKYVGHLYPQQSLGRTPSWPELLELLRLQQTAAKSPQWKDLGIGGRVFRLNPSGE
ncbi:MAG: putative transrane protein [Gammaproteobacteria bacterium]|jgi:hypothetical protein|nr:putative transrane protein [Gammaproteobacteria bacterium]